MKKSPAKGRKKKEEEEQEEFLAHICHSICEKNETQISKWVSLFSF
jgi:hypothetical protein